MAIFSDTRPNPDDISAGLFIKEQNKKGRLEIFFGYAAGVGKTYAMLDDAQEQIKCGVDVLVGYVEEHTHPETVQLISGLPALPPKIVEYRKIRLKEFDLDAALERKPDLILVDELAHTNAPGTRNKKRYQDIEELLNAGIDVFTTVNVQHLESLNDVVQKITWVDVKETIPDYIFNQADKIRLIDIEPDELLRRFEGGKIYRTERTQKSQDDFFIRENLRLLREIAMRKAANRISTDNQNEPRLSKKMANTKLMVCISASPSSARCIRWTNRTAEAFRAPWTAVYVEAMDSDVMTDAEKDAVRDNLVLAERLGAEIVTLNGHDVATVIAEYAKLSGITNIVIGKSRNKKSLLSYLKASLEEKLIAMLPSIEIHIIPGDPGKNNSALYQQRRLRISGSLFFTWQDGLKTLLIIVIATAISLILQALNISDQNIIMVYILSVLIVSRVTTGYVYGILTSCLTVLVFNYFFTIPYYTLHAIQPGYPITFVIMLLVALITSALTVRIKTQAHLAVEREHRTEVLYEINKKLLASRDLKETIQLINVYMVKIFGRSAIFYHQDPKDLESETFQQSALDSDASFLMSESERAVAHWVFMNKKCAGAGTDTLMGAGAFYMPIVSQSKVLGIIGLSCADGVLNQNNRLFLRMIASQVEMALERHYLSNEQRRMIVEAEKEKMRSNLLRGISHDLRTPLTGILGSSSAILENGQTMDQDTQDTLLFNIREDSQWLIRMVENLLSVTRINEGPMNVTKTPEAVEEIVAEAISRIRKRFVNRKIKVKVPEQLLIVPMDGTLIEQVLINLLENAIKYSPEDSVIEVEVKKNENAAEFEVKDQGKGISDQDFPYLFETAVPDGKRSSDSSRGMGIGLSICNSIVKAHHGEMAAQNRLSGGSIFQFTLPLEEESKNG
ncbi:sensor histidine kinase [Acetobacterium woodii]|uniref:histidine kinase n=1 Tax=Acetobacterium woodii (strain ATCC 29683 / DSM 1030 / JCM 2381 / KCTC 1655 / WB1) TaxID=931626 RepID=H6LIZ9_ACEWD|nr:sensor histidine kinase KdpD [Acetobacterium woodii]AFA47362.1 sensor protein KdpD [Acetobacterium woodii DSM 1030]